jgi:ABC-type transporter Mla MlaB component
MVGKQPGRGPGERLTRLPDSRPARPKRIAKRDTAPAASPRTSDPGTWPGGSAPVGRTAPSGSRRVLFSNEIFSIARLSDPVQLILAGEIDMCSVPHLAAALPDAADGSGVLHVDMADVYFCDLAALRTIIGLGQHSDHEQRPARPVALHHLPAHIERVLRILGWDTAPGLTIDTGAPGTPKTRHWGARATRRARDQKPRPGLR